MRVGTPELAQSTAVRETTQESPQGTPDAMYLIGWGPSGSSTSTVSGPDLPQVASRPEATSRPRGLDVAREVVGALESRRAAEERVMGWITNLDTGESVAVPADRLDDFLVLQRLYAEQRQMSADAATVFGRGMDPVRDEVLSLDANTAAALVILGAVLAQAENGGEVQTADLQDLGARIEAGASARDAFLAMARKETEALENAVARARREAEGSERQAHERQAGPDRGAAVARADRRRSDAEVEALGDAAREAQANRLDRADDAREEIAALRPRNA